MLRAREDVEHEHAVEGAQGAHRPDLHQVRLGPLGKLLEVRPAQPDPVVQRPRLQEPQPGAEVDAAHGLGELAVVVREVARPPLRPYNTIVSITTIIIRLIPLVLK